MLVSDTYRVLVKGNSKTRSGATHLSPNKKPRHRRRGFVFLKPLERSDQKSMPPMPPPGGMPPKFFFGSGVLFLCLRIRILRTPMTTTFRRIVEHLPDRPNQIDVARILPLIRGGEIRLGAVEVKNTPGPFSKDIQERMLASVCTF